VVWWVEVSAPPELSTFIVGTRSFTGLVSLFEADPSVGVSTGAVCAGVSEPGVDGFGASDSGSGDVEDGGSESGSGAAHATPGVVATATPTPSDTANAPMRPMYLA
jgi:hypothetical protein